VADDGIRCIRPRDGRSSRSTASIARAPIAASPSPSGNVAADGWPLHDAPERLLAQVLQLAARPGPIADLTQAARPGGSSGTGDRPCSSRAAVSWQRSRGRRSRPLPAARAQPLASAAPGRAPLRRGGSPASNRRGSGPVTAVKPCRTNRTVVTPGATPRPGNSCSGAFVETSTAVAAGAAPRLHDPRRSRTHPGWSSPARRRTA